MYIVIRLKKKDLKMRSYELFNMNLHKDVVSIHKTITNASRAIDMLKPYNEHVYYIEEY